MKMIEGFSGIAPRSGGAKVKYQLWIDENGAMYAQIIENIVKAKRKRGTHTTNLYRVTDYVDYHFIRARDWVLVGIDPKTFEEAAPVRDFNEAGFLKAILKHLFPKPMV